MIIVAYGYIFFLIFHMSSSICFWNLFFLGTIHSPHLHYTIILCFLYALDLKIQDPRASMCKSLLILIFLMCRFFVCLFNLFVFSVLITTWNNFKRFLWWIYHKCFVHLFYFIFNVMIIFIVANCWNWFSEADGSNNDPYFYIYLILIRIVKFIFISR